MDIDAELVLSDREFEEKYILLPPLKCPSHLVTALPLDPFNVSLLYTLLGERREQATSPVLVWCRDRLPAIILTLFKPVTHFLRARKEDVDFFKCLARG